MGEGEREGRGRGIEIINLDKEKVIPSM